MNFMNTQPYWPCDPPTVGVCFSFLFKQSSFSFSANDECGVHSCGLLKQHCKAAQRLCVWNTHTNDLYTFNALQVCLDMSAKCINVNVIVTKQPKDFRLKDSWHKHNNATLAFEAAFCCQRAFCWLLKLLSIGSRIKLLLFIYSV